MSMGSMGESKREDLRHGNFLLDWVVNFFIGFTDDGKKKRKKDSEELKATIDRIFADDVMPCGNTEEYMFTECGRKDVPDNGDRMTLIDVKSLEVLWNPKTKRYYVTIKDRDKVQVGRLIP